MLLRQIIMAVALAFLLVVSASRLLAVLVPGHDRLRQAGHRAAAVAGAVAEEAADYKRPAFSLVGRALHPLALHHLGALSADAILVVHLREVGPAPPHPSVPAYQTVLVDPDPAVDFVEVHFAVDVAPRRVVALADDAAPAAATAHRPKRTAVLLSLLRRVGLPHRASAIARRVGLGLCRVLAAPVRDLRSVRLDGVRHRDELVRLVFLLELAKAPRVLRLPQAVP